VDGPEEVEVVLEDLAVEVVAVAAPVADGKICFV
jgi:hypothetical protein